MSQAETTRDELVSRNELGHRLYVLRHAQAGGRLSLAKVQELTGVPETTLSRWERGRGERYPDLERLEKLADLYQVALPDLLSTTRAWNDVAA